MPRNHLHSPAKTRLQQLLNHPRKIRRIVLTVAVQCCDQSTLSMIDSGDESRTLTAACGVADKPERRQNCPKSRKHHWSLVRAAIVHNDDFESVPPGQRPSNLCQQRRKIRRLVVSGNDH